MKFDANHTPVLLDEVLTALAPPRGARILDTTLGLGGHSKALMEAAGQDAQLVGLDADAVNLRQAGDNLKAMEGSVELIHANFSRLPELGLGTFDVIFADLGVSSPHFDDPERGFSFRKTGLLDMRFDRTVGQTAAELIAASSEQELIEILWSYGEVRQSKSLAKALLEASPQTTVQAYEAIENAVGFRASSIAPQVFQALRIAVNEEIGALEILLATAPGMLRPGGNLGIIAFHSLEDRLVKRKFKELTSVEKDETTGADIGIAPFELAQRKAIKPSQEEIKNNPRARSARLRILQRRSAL